MREIPVPDTVRAEYICPALENLKCWRNNWPHCWVYEDGLQIGFEEIELQPQLCGAYRRLQALRQNFHLEVTTLAGKFRFLL